LEIDNLNLTEARKKRLTESQPILSYFYRWV